MHPLHRLREYSFWEKQNCIIWVGNYLAFKKTAIFKLFRLQLVFCNTVLLRIFWSHACFWGNEVDHSHSPWARHGFGHSKTWDECLTGGEGEKKGWGNVLAPPKSAAGGWNLCLAKSLREEVLPLSDPPATCNMCHTESGSNIGLYSKHKQKLNVRWLWEQLQCLVFISHRLVGKDVPLHEAWLGLLLGLGWDSAGCVLGLGKVTLLFFGGSCPPRWCWSALWRRTWCTQRRTPPSTTGKSTTESSGSLFKAPPTLEPSTEEWGKPSRTSLKVPRRQPLGPSREWGSGFHTQSWEEGWV